ncbi:aspartic peptidase domain-containing protein [Annulohypoxylon truncatum]|uniref:aspartic peptidase domain-containing protein n=1 Tax=Annulohypoxylon truncatum TaxID=327061 RepID=UPI002007212C|nr:aspartic peptidase domain-containing protein [Annulohypoxylon truncatum]KAI1211798.1 aspartic peptidase domain-containing protein [Annulohypoxylon truncatum]
MGSFSALVAAFAAASVVADVAIAQRVIPVGFSKPTARLPALHKRAGTYSQELNNNLTGGGYYAQVTVGTPPQTVDLIVDTGSSDVWILDSNANLCHSKTMQSYYGYCLSTYDPSNSSTYSVVSQDTFNIRYVDGSGAEGNYIKDNFGIGGAEIKALQMGLAENSTINSGLLGIGFAANVAAKTPYPNIMDLFQNQNLTAIQAYSLYLDDLYAATGTILFGGLDTEKFIGELKTVDIQPDRYGNYSSFTVALSSLTTTADNGTVANYTTRSAVPVILDSGTTLTYVPSSMANRIFRAFGAVDDTSGTGLVFVNCDYLDDNKNLTFDFQFGGGDGPVVRVPIDEMVLNNVQDYVELGLDVPSLPFDNVCSFGLQPNSDYYLLGDTFLRSAYVVYDLTNKQIGLAQANLNSTKSNVVEITQESGIPDASGVASQVTAEQTATGLPGTGNVNGGQTTTTVSSSSTSSSQSSGNAGARTVPAPNREALAVAAITGLCGLMGVGLVVL